MARRFEIASRFASALLLIGVSTPLAAKPTTPPPAILNDTALAALKTKHYPVALDVLRPAIVVALQTIGYINIKSDATTGIISAQADANAQFFHLRQSHTAGFGGVQIASIFVENAVEGGSVIRISLSINERVHDGIWSTLMDDDSVQNRPMVFGEPYRELIETIDSEVARRIALAPTPHS